MKNINKLILPILSSFLLFSCGNKETSSSELSSEDQSILSSEEVSSIVDTSIEEISSSEDESTSSEEVKNNKTYFGVLSDIHLQTEDLTSEMYFRNAIKRFIQEAEDDGGELTGVIIAGDLVDSTWYQHLVYEDEQFYNNKEHHDKQINYAGNIFNDALPEGMPLLYSLGNHDNSGNTYEQGTSHSNAINCGESSRRYHDIFNNIRPEFFSFDDLKDHSSIKYSSEEMYTNGLRLAHINNTHIVMIDNYTYNSTSRCYQKDSLTWLDGTLHFLERMYPDDPVFVVTHNPVSDTTLGSIDDKACTDLTSILVNYPSAITLSGHVHYDNYSEYAIDGNKGFITFDTTCCKMANPTHYADKNHKGIDDKLEYDVQYANNSYTSSEGSLFIIDEEGNTTIKRLDLLHNIYSGPDWEIPSPRDENRVNYFKDEYRLANNTAPYFDDDSWAKVETTGDYLNVIFSKAKYEKLPTYSYRVNALNATGEVIDSLLISSGRNVAYETNQYYVTFDNSDNNIEKFDIYAENSLYQVSEPISVSKKDFQPLNDALEMPIHHGEFMDSLGSIKYGDYELYPSSHYKYDENNVLTNYKSSHGIGNIFFDCIDTNYTFSYKVHNARCNRGHTSYGYSQANYTIGACLATYVYNGRQISLTASIEFSSGGTERVTKNNISYRLLIGTPGGRSWSYSKELTKLNVALENPEAIKAQLESDEGARLKVVRSGTTFSFYLDKTLLDQKDFNGSYFYNHTYIPFNASYSTGFGIYTYGGEAYFDSPIVSLQ